MQENVPDMCPQPGDGSGKERDAGGMVQMKDRISKNQMLEDEIDYWEDEVIIAYRKLDSCYYLWRSFREDEIREKKSKTMSKSAPIYI